MNAQAKRRITTDQAAGMSSALISSLVFHGAVIIVAMFGLPHIAKDRVAEIKPIPIELVEIGDITQTTKPAEKSVPKPVEEKKAPPKPEPERPKQAPQQLAEVTPQAAKPPIDDLALPSKEKEKPKEVKKVEVPKEKPQPPKRRPTLIEEKAKEAPKDDPFASLLKNLQEQKPETAEGEGKEAVQEQAHNLPIGEKMTISEMDALALQLRQCWNVLAGARYAENLVVDIKLYMNSDGMVRQAVVVNQMRYNTDSIFRAAADSALRAVRDPYCTPFRLPLEKYNDWKVINATFDPSQIL